MTAIYHKIRTEKIKGISVLYHKSKQTKQKNQPMTCLSQGREENEKEVFLLMPMPAADLVMTKECKSKTGEILILPLGVPKYFSICRGTYMKNMSDTSEALRIEAQKAR